MREPAARLRRSGIQSSRFEDGRLKLLIDTHLAVWVALERHRLRASERKLLESPSNEIVLSAVSLWELGLKWRSYNAGGVRKGPVAPDTVLLMAEALGWTLLRLEPRHAVEELTPSLPHKDPFDELLLVQAQSEGLRLLTRDTMLADHPLALIAE